MSVWGEVASVLDVYGLLPEYGGSLMTPADSTCQSEGLHITHCGKEGK